MASGSLGVGMCAILDVTAPSSTLHVPNTYPGFVGQYRVRRKRGGSGAPEVVNGRFVFEQVSFGGCHAHPPAGCAVNPYAAFNINGKRYGRASLYYDWYDRAWKIGPGEPGNVVYSLAAESAAMSPDAVRYGHEETVPVRAGTFPQQRVRSGWMFLAPTPSGGAGTVLVPAPGVQLRCLGRLQCPAHEWTLQRRRGVGEDVGLAWDCKGRSSGVTAAVRSDGVEAATKSPANQHEPPPAAIAQLLSRMLAHFAVLLAAASIFCMAHRRFVLMPPAVAPLELECASATEALPLVVSDTAQHGMEASITAYHSMSS